jgi:DNA-binding transcriptional regulator GbsR (MarR family)
MDPRTSRFTDRVAELFELEGLPPIAGRIFALLLLSEDARSLDDLSEELGVSKASASTNARLLAQIGVVESARRAGSRRDY